MSPTLTACQALTRFMLMIATSTGEVERELVQLKGGQAASTPIDGPTLALEMRLAVLLSTPHGAAIALFAHPWCVRLIQVAALAAIDRQDADTQLACGPLRARHALSGGPSARLRRQRSHHVVVFKVDALWLRWYWRGGCGFCVGCWFACVGRCVCRRCAQQQSQDGTPTGTVPAAASTAVSSYHQNVPAFLPQWHSAPSALVLHLLAQPSARPGIPKAACTTAAVIQACFNNAPHGTRCSLPWHNSFTNSSKKWCPSR